MKRIKKITASLLALAITCAGINCIPASAIYTSHTFYTYGAVSYSAVAATSYLLHYQYTAATTSRWPDVDSRNVNAIADCGIQIWYPTPGYSSNKVATLTFALPNGEIQRFDVNHWVSANYYNPKKPYVTGNYGYSIR